MKSLSDVCRPSATPKSCLRDGLISKFDRWGSFYWSVPLQEALATQKTGYWSTRAQEYLVSTDAEMIDISPKDRRPLPDWGGPPYGEPKKENTETKAWAPPARL